MIPSRLLRPLQAALLVEIVLLGLGARPTGDDGFYIASGYMVAHGLKPFIDFSYTQGPLLPYLLAPVVGLLGPTLLASRLFAIVFLILAYWACLKITEAAWCQSWPEAWPNLDALKATLTLLFILYPELLGALSRVGSKESLASLCCALAVGTVVLLPGKPTRGAIAAGLFTGISIGIKYTSAIVAVPVLAFLLYAGSSAQVAAYLLSTATTSAFLIGPFLFSGYSDAVAENFLAVVRLAESKSPGLGSHILETSLPAIPALLRLAAKLQLVLLPSMAWAWFEAARGGWRAFLKRPHNLILGAFFS